MPSLLCSVNFHLEINNPEECTAIEHEFAEEIKKRGEDFKYYKDQVSTAGQTIIMKYEISLTIEVVKKDPNS